jgi:hypothetical protein
VFPEQFVHLRKLLAQPKRGAKLDRAASQICGTRGQSVQASDLHPPIERISRKLPRPHSILGERPAAR